MNKIRPIIVMALIGAMLTGCAEKNEKTAEEATAAATEAITTVPSVTTAEVIEETETETETPEEEPFSLEKSNSEERKIIIEKLLEMKNDEGNNIFNPNAPESLFTVISSDEFSVDTTFVILPDITADTAFEQDIYRKPTTFLYTENTEYDSFYKAVDDAEKSKYSHTFSNYDIDEENAVVRIRLDENLNPEIVSITRSYTISNLSFNGFVKQNKSGTYEVIIDPAYTYGIPMLSYMKLYGHNINGMNTLMDTISFTAEKLDGAVFSYSDYVYADITVDSLTVSYDSIGSNFSYAPKITSFEVLYENGAEAISSAELLKKFDEKNDGSAAIYKTLTDNLDVFMGEDVVGTSLIDLDFDGTPEVFVSRKVMENRAYDYGEETVEFADVDVYTIADGKLNYVDTLYNHKINVYQNGNVIGIKTTDKMEKKWFTMSRKNIKTGENQDVDYLFTLENDKLNYTEVFRNDSDGENGSYYFFGEKIVPEVTLGQHPYAEGDEPEDYEYYSWNGISASFGMWELWGFIRAEYCKDIGPSFDLYSHWLSSGEVYEESTKINLNKRTMEYKLAYLVDAFYYGYYDKDDLTYHYSFLGDYAKPVIYLYPEEETEVSVKVKLNGGELTCTYPDYRDGWNVTAYPDGTIIDNADGNEYYCLYWEGIGKSDWDMSKGFVVKREDTADFLREKLAEIGLTPRESNEFIIYWLPELQKNECNLITFQTEQYEKNAVLDIDPVPDNMLRVFMVYNECDSDTVIEPQSFEPFERNGFTVVEWGGSHAE